MKKIAGFLIFAFAFILSACRAGGPSKTIQVKLSDFAITPNQFTVSTDTEVAISVTNNGIVEHDFNIMKFGVDIGEKFDDEDRGNIIWELEVQPGEAETKTFTVPEQSGIYQVVCAMPGHLQAGMLGTLEVVK